MELLIGAIVAVLTQVYKKLLSKWPQTQVNLVIYLVVFVLCFLWAWLINKEVISLAMLQNIGVVFTAAIGFYEVVIKWLLKEVLKLPI